MELVHNSAQPRPQGFSLKKWVGREIDCKTVGFFLKISKEIGNAWRKSLTREAREPHTPYGRVPSLALCSRPFV